MGNCDANWRAGTARLCLVTGVAGAHRDKPDI
jgi:hypothetical protein